MNNLDIDYKTAGMVDAVSELESGYDGLFNKYYNLLMKKLNSSDKEIMKRSQLNWIKFRDSEKRVNEMLAKKEYSEEVSCRILLLQIKTHNKRKI